MNACDITVNSPLKSVVLKTSNYYNDNYKKVCLILLHFNGTTVYLPAGRLSMCCTMEVGMSFNDIQG